MKKIDVARAWRDEEYRNGLSEAERASLPEHPVGLAEVNDEVLTSTMGGCFRPSSPGYTTSACSCVPPGTQCP